MLAIVAAPFEYPGYSLALTQPCSLQLRYAGWSLFRLLAYVACSDLSNDDDSHPLHLDAAAIAQPAPRAASASSSSALSSAPAPDIASQASSAQAAAAAGSNDASFSKTQTAHSAA